MSRPLLEVLRYGSAARATTLKTGEAASMLSEALRLLALKLSVIPLHAPGMPLPRGATEDQVGKVPLIRWTVHQSRLATEEEVRRWWIKWPKANIGVATGRLSGVIVLDVDGGKGQETLGRMPPAPSTWRSRSARGAHLWLRHPGGVVRNFAGRLPGLDLRGDGGYAVAPPSLHRSGCRYEWVLAPEQSELAEVPGWLLELIQRRAGTDGSDGEERDWLRLLQGVPLGKRHDTAVRIAGHFLGIGREPAEVEALLLGFAAQCVPPHDPEDVRRIVRDLVAKGAAKTGRGARAAGATKRDRPTQAEALIALAADAHLFHDEQGEACAVVPVAGHLETHRLRERGFKRWLVHRMYESKGKVPNAEAIGQALNLLEARAIFDGPRHELAVRVTQRDGVFYYDLADREWRVVEVDATGWRCVPGPFLFRRGANTRPQATPAQGGNIRRALDLVNLAGEDDRLLFLVYLVTCLVPGIPHPLPILSGEKGAAKSTMTRVIRRLVDPADEELLSLPEDPNELALLLSRNYVAAFDNLDGLHPWQSDLLSRAVTGGGITKRRLYTDDEEIILKFRRCVALNGINPAATRPDLLDRAIHFTLERIPSERRRQEGEFWAAFEEARPGIFGAMLDALSGAMGIYPAVSLARLPRMADFCRWGYAAAEVLGLGGEAFLQAYWRALGWQNEAAIQAHPVAAAVVALMGDKASWEGPPADLLTALERVGEAERIDMKARSWPKAAHILTRRLREVKTNLFEAGILFDEARPHGRLIILRRVGESGVGSDAGEDGEGNRDVEPDVSHVASGPDPAASGDARANVRGDAGPTGHRQSAYRNADPAGAARVGTSGSSSEEGDGQAGAGEGHREVFEL